MSVCAWAAPYQFGTHGGVRGQPATPVHEGFSCMPPAYCGDNLLHEVGVSLTRIGGTPLRMDITRRLGDFGDIPGGRVVLGFGMGLNKVADRGR